MSAVNENLVTQVAALVDILLETCTAYDAGTGAADTTTQSLQRYTQQIECIVSAAESEAFFGLHNVCVLYQEILQQLADGTSLSEQARVLLEEWPTLVITYLELPDDPHACAALAEHLGNSSWPMPVEAAEVELLKVLLAQQAVLGEENDSAHTTVTDTEEDLVFATAGGNAPAIFDFDMTSEVTEQSQDDVIEVFEPITFEAADASWQVTPTPIADPTISEVTGQPQEDDVQEPVTLGSASEDITPAVTPDTVGMEVNEFAAESWQETLATRTDSVDLDQETTVMSTDSVDLETVSQASTHELASHEPATSDTEPDAPGVDASIDMAQAVPTLSANSLETPVESSWADDEALEDPAAIAAELETVVENQGEVQEDEPEASFLSAMAEVTADNWEEAVADTLEEVATGWEDVSAAELDDTVATSIEATMSIAWADADAGAFDDAAREILDVLSLEVTQLAEALTEALSSAGEDDWRQVLTDHAEDLERLGEGATAVGLVGLQRVSECLGANLLHLVAQKPSLNAAQRQVVCDWAPPILNYLQGLSNPARGAALVQYLQDPRWPQPLPEVDGAELRQALVVTSLDVMAEEHTPRQRYAELQDITMTLPEDVNPELLSSLLQELPIQAANFSAAIQRLTSGAGTIADVDAAQRIAHALKGAASTVGVAGVTNLTHHLEDILLALSKHNVLPSPALNQTLIGAADCLEAMSETLIGVGNPAPAEEARGVLQMVLDWANLIDRQGVPHTEVQPQVREPQPVTPATSMTHATPPPQAKPVTSGTHLATDLVDELMRLAGEGMILNGQLHDRLERTAQQMRALRAQHNTLQQLVLELEELVDIRGVSSPLFQRTTQGQFDPLEMEQYNELHTVSRRLLEGMADAREMNREVDNHLTTLHELLTNQRRTQQENETTVMRTRMVSVNTIAPRLHRGVRQTCRLTDKEAELVLSGGETLMDSNILNSMIDPLMHMLRNAVDHGIEPPDEREQLGKPRTGTVTLAFTRAGNSIVVRCHDDGAGLNYEAIRHTAVERGLISAHQTLPQEELGRLILRPGFSTRLLTTQVSGRGIGMDAVYSRVQELKGSLQLTSGTNKGCLIELRLPVTLLSTHGLLVRVGKQVMAVSNLSIEQLLSPGAGQLGQVGNKTTYQMGDEIFEAVTLEALLNLPPDQRQTDRNARPGLLLQDESGRRRVVLVQEILASQALVVKNLGRYVPVIRGLVGVTILGDGSATPVLDLPDLLRRPVSTSGHLTTHQTATPVATNKAPVALIVDDSLSARRSATEFIKDLGFEVRTAGDGLEAIAILDHLVPDLLVVDLEMPRMNGLELTTHVRSHTATAHVPIIMVTSRSTEKHRRTAAEAGVNAYLVKPFVENELITHIQQLITLPGAA